MVFQARKICPDCSLSPREREKERGEEKGERGLKS
jgi:hypothetical protein